LICSGGIIGFFVSVGIYSGTGSLIPTESASPILRAFPPNAVFPMPIYS